MEHLKTIFKSNDEKLIDLIKNKLKNCIADADWDIEEFIEHDYCKPEFIECVMYYMTGFFSNRIIKTMKCEICIKAITNHKWFTQEEAMLQIYEDKLAHVNTHFHNFIKNLESIFLKHCENQNVLELMLDDIVEKNILSFPCKDHKDEIVPYIVFHYIQFRMRQFCKVKNAEKKKENLLKRKQSKFCKT